MESKNLHGGFATPILTDSISCLPPGAYGVSGYRIEGKSKIHVRGKQTYRQGFVNPKIPHFSEPLTTYFERIISNWIMQNKQSLILRMF
jgi:hypothetical protein